MKRVAGWAACVVPLFLAGAGCATESGEDGESSAEAALVSDIPEQNAQDYVADDNAVFSYASIGTQAGLFRFPIGGGAPTFIDGYNAERTRRYAGDAQIVGADLYYVVEIYESVSGHWVPRRELTRVPRSGGAPVKVMDVPEGQIVVGKTVVYVATEGNDYYGDISVLELGGSAPAKSVASREYFARDLRVIGDKLFWRSDWAGLTNNSLKFREFEPGKSVRTFDLGPERHELQRILVDGSTVYALGEGDVWSVDAATDALTELPSLHSRIASAGVSYCGDDYPYGLGSSVIRGGKLYAYCTNWDDRSKRFILAFGLTTATVKVVTAVASTRAWFLEASKTRLFWLENTGYDLYAMRSSSL
jgi:hypothetical protein